MTSDELQNKFGSANGLRMVAAFQTPCCTSGINFLAFGLHTSWPSFLSETP